MAEPDKHLPEVHSNQIAKPVEQQAGDKPDIVGDANIIGDDNVSVVVKQSPGTVVGIALSEPRLEVSLLDVQEHCRRLSGSPPYARWADLSDSEHYISTTELRLPLYASPYEDLTGSRIELLEAIKTHSRLLVLAEPGMGKTVALERAVWQMAHTEGSPVPILVRLIHYDGDLWKNIGVALNETGVLKLRGPQDIKSFLDKCRCIFLIDGLNEIGGSWRQKAAAQLGEFLREFSQHPVILTSRTQDDLWPRFHQPSIIENAVVIQPITDQDVHKYLVKHLDEKGRKLYDCLNEALRGLSHIPLLLWLIKEVGESGKELPGNRGQLFDSFVNQVLRRERKQPEFASVPDSQKKSSLGRLAFKMQERYELACSREMAISILGSQQEVVDAQVVIREGLWNGLLTGDDKIHFMHQAVHEYFVGLRIRELLSEQIQKPRLIHFNRVTDRAREPRWAECFVQAAGLVKNELTDVLIKEILRTNPWLAYWCSIEGNEVKKGEVKQAIESKTVALLQSKRVQDRRQVVSELSRMENPRTIGYLLKALDDPDDMLRAMSIQSLARQGEPCVDPLLERLNATSPRLRLAATKTLGMIWRLPSLIELGEPDSQRASAAADQLGRTKETKAVKPLIGALKDNFPTVRYHAAVALGKIGNSQAIQPLLNVSTYDIDKQVREAASIALRRIVHDPETRKSIVRTQKESWINKPNQVQELLEIDALLAALRASDVNSRYKAAQALGEHGDRSAVKGLVLALSDGSPDVREEAAKALGKLGDPNAIGPLTALLRDPFYSDWRREFPVRTAARRALRQIATPKALAMLRLYRPGK